MVELDSDKCVSCKLCAEQSTHNLCIANCIGCKDPFCFEHLIEHRKQSFAALETLIERHAHMDEAAFAQLDFHPHLEYIERWEAEIMEVIHKHTSTVKEKIRAVFETYKSELKKYHAMLGKKLDEQRDSKTCLERNLSNLSQQIEQLDKEIQQMNTVIRQMSHKELYSIVNKLNVSTSTLGKPLQWTCSHEIKLDSTYGYMAANNQQIFLGWKNRIVIYNLNGTKHDETRLRSTETYGELCDLTWSATMHRFFILCQKSLFVHHPSSSQVEIVDNISLIDQDNQYISLTTHGIHLFVLNRQSLEIWQLSQQTFLLQDSILLSFIVKHPAEESICCIRANDEHLAVLIQNSQTRTWRLDLFNLHPFSRFHMGTPFDRYTQPSLGSITAFYNKSYLFMNWETKLMHLIDANGSNELIDYNAYNACLMGSQRLLAVNYMTHLKIYAF